MAFQSTINRFATFGIQGDLANGQVPHYSALTPRVKSGETIYAGDFVWVADKGNGDAEATKAGSGKPTGIVQRVLDVALPTADAATLQIPVGRKCAVIVWGDVFVKTTDTASVGKKLFVNNTTGAITCGNAGASVSGATETDWTIVSLAGNVAAAGGSVVIASNV